MRPSRPPLLVFLQQYSPAILLCLTIAILAAPPCSGQRRGTVEITPLLGAYTGMSQLPGVSTCHCTCLRDAPDERCLSSRQQSTALAVGGRVTAWVNRRIALDGSLWYSPSPVADETSRYQFGAFAGTTTTHEATADIVASNVRVLVSFIRRARAWAYVAAGPAWVTRFGAADFGFSGMTRVGGVVGAGAHLRVAGSLALRGELEQYLYSVDGYHQRDLFLSLGLSVASRGLER